MKYKVRYAPGDKAIEISKNRGIRIFVDCDDIDWQQPDPRTVASLIADWLNTGIMNHVPTLLDAETERARRK